MATKDMKYEFQKDINMRVDVLRNIVINFQYSKHLFLNSSSQNLNQHWIYIRNNFFSMLFIDLAKLFVDSKSHKYNFFAFLKEISKTEYSQFGFDQTMIEEFRKNLTEQIDFFKTRDVNGKQHSGIPYYRDKFFAHYEIIVSLVPQEKFFTGVENLINLALEILNTTSKIVLDRPPYNFINLVDLSTLNTN